ncbi:MAG: formyltransferase family protein [Oscillospiraceae bacterium]
MKILFLYNNDIAIKLADWLSEKGNEVTRCSDHIDGEWLKSERFDLLVSYTYKFIVAQEIVDIVGGNIINLHISYLPWNRGADPNLWSWIEDSPKGVSIHFINAGCDKGDIIAQKLVELSEHETLASSYRKLNDEIIELFKDIYPYRSHWKEMRKRTIGQGSYHSVADFLKYKPCLVSFEETVKEFLQRINLVKSAD